MNGKNLAGKRIVFVNTSFGVGGVELIFIEMARQLEQRGAVCHFFSLLDQTSMLQARNIPDSSIHILFKNRTQKPSFQEMARQAFKMHRYIRNLSPDAVFTGLYLPAFPLWLGNLFFRRLPVAFFLMQTGSYLKRHTWFWKSRLMYWGNKKIIALGDFLKKDHIRRFPGYRDRFATCVLPVDTQRFHPRDPGICRTELGLPLHCKIVGACSRLSPEKDLERFVSAIKAMNDDHVIGVIYGDGPEKERLEAMIAEQGLQEKILLRPASMNTPVIMNAFDVYLQTTRGPNLGASVLESFASGVPVVIATRDAEEVEMAEDTFHTYEAGLISGAGPSEIAARIREVLYSEKLADFKKNALDLAHTVYDWNTFIRDLTAAVLSN